MNTLTNQLQGAIFGNVVDCTILTCNVNHEGQFNSAYGIHPTQYFLTTFPTRFVRPQITNVSNRPAALLIAVSKVEGFVFVALYT